MVGTTLFQIHLTGYYACFEGKTKIISKNVYLSTPSQKEIDTFVDKCCGGGFYDLKREGLEIKILELKISK